MQNPARDPGHDFASLNLCFIVMDWRKKVNPKEKLPFIGLIRSNAKAPSDEGAVSRTG